MLKKLVWSPGLNISIQISEVCDQQITSVSFRVVAFVKSEKEVQKRQKIFFRVRGYGYSKKSKTNRGDKKKHTQKRGQVRVK